MHLKNLLHNFYNISEILSYSKYNIFFSLGGRNIGKSTGWMKYVIHAFIKKGKKFGIIVKYKDDLYTFAPNYFSSEWFKQWYPDYEFKYSRQKYYIRHKKDKMNESDEKSGWKQCGYAIALSMNATIKSTTKYHEVDILLFEEFMPLDNRYIGSIKDPEKEPRLLQSVYQSIARGTKGQHTRPVQLILISNNYSMNNPYFTFYHILNMITNNPNSIYQRFYTYDDDKLHYVVEFSQLQSESTGIETDDESYGIKFSDFRNELKYTNDKPKKIMIQLTFDDKYYISIARYNDSILAFHTRKTKDSDDILIYSCSKFKTNDALGIKLFKNTEFYRVISRLFESNAIYYDRMETFIHLTNILAF